ncbi:MAG: phospho-sugar mutase [Balneolaceae bacterium]
MKNLNPEVLERIESWLDDSYDPDTRAWIQKMLEEERYEELSDAFYKDLEFGTGGMRGVMGVGTNRMNKYMVAWATQGFSNYLKQIFGNEPIRVAVARDNRNNAELFSGIVADVFSANGIQVHVFSDLRPTPELSYAIRQLKCHAGVMLTASHNPKEYSGFKAYWRDGGQLVEPHAEGVVEQVQRVSGLSEIQMERDPELVEVVGEDIDRRYVETLLTCQINREAVAAEADLPIVYSPIHGTGVKLVPDTLRAAGFTNLHLVEEQCVVDGNFPTVVYPNPEEKEALAMAIEKANETDAELVMATDPDGDRVGIVVRNEKSELEMLNGNQTAALLFHYLLGGWKENRWLTGDEYVVKTIVTSYQLDRIAEAMGVSCYNVLTGFKYIGDMMTRLEGKKRFLIGGEESYGYLIGDHVRDKDAVVSCLLIAEMAASYKQQGKSLFEVLREIAIRYGFYRERLISVTRKGKSGEDEIRRQMKAYREAPPVTFAGARVLVVKDYLTGIQKDLETGLETEMDYPASNVLQFATDRGDLISVRPSGTEPKIKFYISVQDDLADIEGYREKEMALEQRLDQIAEELSA